MKSNWFCFPGSCLLLGRGMEKCCPDFAMPPPAFQFITLAEAEYLVGVSWGILEFAFLGLWGRLHVRQGCRKWVLWWELGHWQLPACGVLSQQYLRVGQHQGCRGMLPHLPVGFPQPNPAHGSGEGHWDLGMQRQALILISGFSDPLAGGSSSLSVEPNVT